MITLAVLRERFWTIAQGGRSQAEHSDFAELRIHRFEFRGTEVTTIYGVGLQKGGIHGGNQGSGNSH